MSYHSIENQIGNTPLVRIKRLPGETTNTVLLKLEGNNPAGSVKDRPALSMILQAELRGDISPGDVLIEATSGNTGIALAMVAAVKGYPLILIMPDNSSDERKSAMTAYGAELIEVTAEQGMEGARDLAQQMQAEAFLKANLNALPKRRREVYQERLNDMAVKLNVAKGHLASVKAMDSYTTTLRWRKAENFQDVKRNW